MEVEDYIEKIIDNNRVEDMHELSEIFEDVMEHLKNCDEKKYKKYELELYKMAYGNVLNRKMAEKIVNNMQPYGMHWDYEEIKDFQNQYNLEDFRTVDVFVVMNSAYNDYSNLFDEDLQMYAKFTKDFINDEDAKEGKVFLYFTIIPNE